MTHLRPSRAVGAIVILVLAAAVAQAQPPQQNKAYEPQYGQAGKDVVWVPTSPALVQKMLDLGQVTANDVVIDLGSGDGRTVIAAAKRGARAFGIEYEPDMVELSKANAAKEGLADKATFVKADLFESDFSQATVITMFLLTDINLRLRPKLLDLKPGTRIVTNTFKMGEWQEDGSATVEQDCTSWCTAYLWIVPAKVEGTWRLGNKTLTFSQSFQMVAGTLADGTTTTALYTGRLAGDEISFTVGESTYTGRVGGTTMSGTVTTGTSTANWTATRVQ
jgi:hypothetical protein